MKPATKRALKYAAIALVCATLVGLAEATQLYLGRAGAGRPIAFTRAMMSTMPSWYVLITLIPMVVYVARRFPLETLRTARGIAVHTGAAIAFAVTDLTLITYISRQLLGDVGVGSNFVESLSRLFGVYFVGELIRYGGIVGVYFALEYNRRYREKERTAAELALKASRLEASLTSANLEALRMQLNPHFLFNTLNTISVLALKGERQRVARMLSRLSDLLRLSLENDRQTLSLEEELSFLERYLEIEQVRFKDRLSVDIAVDEAAQEAEVPSLLLQPIVENALRYGFAQTIGPGRVAITGRVRSGTLELEVSDTGPGFPADQTQNGGTGVGLTNTRARLEQLYGGNFVLELSNPPEGGALVRVRLPYRRWSGRPSQDTMARQA